VYVVVRTVDRKTNATGKHALLGPAPVKLSMCWVLSACNGYCSNEEIGGLKYSRSQFDGVLSCRENHRLRRCRCRGCRVYRLPS
jgi:hypothetical protein